MLAARSMRYCATSVSADEVTHRLVRDRRARSLVMFRRARPGERSKVDQGQDASPRDQEEDYGVALAEHTRA